MAPGVRGCWAWLAEFPLLFLPTPEPMGFSPLPSCSQICYASAQLLCLLLPSICAFKQTASPLGWFSSFVFTVGINLDLQCKRNLQQTAPCLLLDLGNAAGLGSCLRSVLFFKVCILGVLWEEGVSLSALGWGLSWAWHPLGLESIPPCMGGGERALLRVPPLGGETCFLPRCPHQSIQHPCVCLQLSGSSSTHLECGELGSLLLTGPSVLLQNFMLAHDGETELCPVVPAQNGPFTRVWGSGMGCPTPRCCKEEGSVKLQRVVVAVKVEKSCNALCSNG